MRPFFTSRTEWLSASTDEQTYVRDATGHLVRAGFLGLFVLAGPVGAVDSYWRSLPVVALFVVCLVTAAGLGALLFRREWRAAAHTYGIPIHTANSAPEGAAQ